MGKITGFIEYDRSDAAHRAPAERVGDYKEFSAPYSHSQANEQSARCMDCGVPFCHNGCPLGNLIPEFNDAVYRSDWKEAYEILVSTNNFPEFTGRICPAPCESACVLGINRAPVSIEEIEKYIIETAFDKGYVQAKRPILQTGKKVAVVGSGPAGLAAAAQLNQAGHTVTVFERDEAPGGLLRFGIPDFKLEKSVVARRVALMEAEGIQFRCGVEVGVHVHVDELQRDYQAIVLAGGCTVPRDLNVPGRQLKGVHFAMEFLTQQNRRVSGFPVGGTALSATGKNVVVIGGGDTGSDCVGTSNRHGASSVTQIELLPKPPETRGAATPWPQYPMVLKTTSSHEEGCERAWAIATKAFLGDENGQLRALLTVALDWETGTDGRPGKFIERLGSEREIPCDLVLLAMGFVKAQSDGMLSDLNVELDARGNVRASERTYRTNLAHVFTCGDMRRGQSLVVWAISEGRECARKVDEFLMKTSLLETKDASKISDFTAEMMLHKPAY